MLVSKSLFSCATNPELVGTSDVTTKLEPTSSSSVMVVVCRCVREQMRVEDAVYRCVAMWKHHHRGSAHRARCVMQRGNGRVQCARVGAIERAEPMQRP